MPTKMLQAATAISPAAEIPGGQCHLITPEYPPMIGGLADYTRIIARELQALGWSAEIWVAHDEPSEADDSGLSVHHLGLLKNFRRVSAAGRQLDRYPAPHCLIVQWVPHGYGCRSMNLLFCLWLWWRRARRGDQIVLMVHEPSLGFVKGNLKHNLVAAVHRLMTIVLMQAASRVCMSIPAWRSRLEPYAWGRRIPFSWLPIPSNVAALETLHGGRLRRTLAGESSYLIGHFGTHGGPIAALLEASLPQILAAEPDAKVLLIGQNGEAVRERLPAWRGRIEATGVLSSADLSAHLQVCDVMLQPYPDGVSTRRGSAMAALAHGVPLVTTVGELSEEFWRGNQFARTVPAARPGDLAEAVSGLLRDPGARAQFGAAGQRLYRNQFAPRRIAARLAGFIARPSQDPPPVGGIAQ